jgi:hypothetical protein
MRLLADENLPLPTIEAIRQAGYDVAWARTNFSGTSDSALLDIAEDESRVFPVQSQHLLHRLQRNPVDAAMAPPLVKQPGVAELFMALLDPPHRPVGHARDLRVVYPSDLLGDGFQNHVL